ncbi:cytochrome P450 [Streptosporangium sp. H16]|uniref:cytochrome P450 n=1 Tax=Streptosporangium sp. H16 TaxID=3444184 RepID=UPI003F7A2BC9
MLTVRAAGASPFTAVRDGERDAIYAELLSTGPAHPMTARSGPVGWLITGHEEARSLLSDPRLVKGGRRYGTYAARLPQELARGAYSHMLLADGADHARLRKLVTSVFTRRRIEKLAPRIQRLTDDLLSACDGSDSVDLVSALLANPGQLALLRDDPGLLEAAIEELLRYDGPVQNTMPYVAAEPIEVGGVRIEAGETVIIALQAANRDPARFPEGDRLDLTRQRAPHTAFGHGMHYCLGASLARVEARIALGTLLARYPPPATRHRPRHRDPLPIHDLERAQRPARAPALSLDDVKSSLPAMGDGRGT